MAGEFLDSNVLVYAFTDDPRAEAAQELLDRGCTISVQGLNDFANVARRKLGKSWPEIRTDLAATLFLTPPAPRARHPLYGLSRSAVSTSASLG